MDSEVSCPHCGGWVIVAAAELNCRIFRHGILVADGQQMNPHAPKAVCDALFASGAIHGCGKPFRVIGNPGSLTAVECEYI